jgi:hypothetical protein
VGSAPILVTTRITPTLRPLAAANPVQLKWRRMYLAENILNMVDNGTGGDVTAGDGIWTAQIPTTSLFAG